MYYIEFLRARRTIYWVAAWLSLFAAIALWVRIEVGLSHHHMSASDSHAVVPLIALIAMGSIVSAIVATILGCGLARQNSGHLAIAWTKPLSRVGVAGSQTLVDLAAIYVAFGLGLAFAIGIAATVGTLQNLQIESSTAWFVARELVFPLAWYGLVMAATASMRSRAGAVAATLWIAGVVLIGLDQSHVFGGTLATIISTLDHLNPMYYAELSFDDKGNSTSLVTNPVVSFAGLSALAMAGYAAALAQWRRLEA